MQYYIKNVLIDNLLYNCSIPKTFICIRLQNYHTRLTLCDSLHEKILKIILFFENNSKKQRCSIYLLVDGGSRCFELAEDIRFLAKDGKLAFEFFAEGEFP